MIGACVKKRDNTVYADPLSTKQEVSCSGFTGVGSYE